MCYVPVKDTGGAGTHTRQTQEPHILVKRHRGEPGRTQTGTGTGSKTPGGARTHTRDTRAHTSTRITQKNLTTIQTHQHTPRTTARRPNPRPAQQPQPRSRTTESAAGSSRSPGAERSPRPSQKRPPPANPTRPPPAPRAPPRACSKVARKRKSEMKARAADA